MLDLTQLLWTLAVAGVGAFAGTYIREKGKNLATREDLEPLVRGQESIKQQLAHSKFVEGRHWDQKRETASELLTHLSKALAALKAQEGWYVEPGSEYADFSDNPGFASLTHTIAEALYAIEERTGPAELFLPQSAVEALKHLAREEWHVGYHAGGDRYEYVSKMLELVKGAQTTVLKAAKAELEIPATDR